MIDPERAVLVLAFGSDVDLSLMRPEYFTDPWCRRVWGHIVDWKVRKVPGGPILFDMEHQLDGHFRDAYVDYADALIPETWPSYVRIVRKESYNYKVYELAEKAKVTPAEEMIAIIDAFQVQLKRMDGPGLAWSEPKDHAIPFMERMEALRLITEPELKSGFPRVDRTLWGLKRGKVITIGARTGRGKSVFLINVASHLLSRGKRVLYFSTEMSTDEKWCRLLSLRTGIEAEKFLRARFEPEEWKRIGDQVEILFNENNFIVCDLVSPDIAKVREAVDRLKPDVVMLDYLGMFLFPKADRPDLRIGEFMKQVKIVAREFDVNVMVASQLNRSVDSREGHIPTLADLKESGNIEQESDIVMLLYDEEEELKNAPVRTLVGNIDKNRGGRCGTVKFTFYAETMRIVEQPLVDYSRANPSGVS